MMVLSWKESLERIKPPEVRAKEWNDAVRAGMIEAGKWLIQKNLRESKFDRSKQRVYNFAPRSVKYVRRKANARLVRDPETRLMVQPARPTADLVYTGRLRDFIMARDPNQYRMITTATSNKIRLRIPIPVPGRVGGYMKAAQYAELSRWTQQEYVEMRRIIVSVIASKLGFGGSHTEENLWRRAG